MVSSSPLEALNSLSEHHLSQPHTYVHGLSKFCFCNCFCCSPPGCPIPLNSIRRALRLFQMLLVGLWRFGSNQQRLLPVSCPCLVQSVPTQMRSWAFCLLFNGQSELDSDIASPKNKYSISKIEIQIPTQQINIWIVKYSDPALEMHYMEGLHLQLVEVMNLYQITLWNYKLRETTGKVSILKT